MRLQPFRDVGLDDAALELAWREHATRHVPRLDALWQYYRNELVNSVGGIGMGRVGRVGRAWYGQGQEIGLPARLRGVAGSTIASAARRKWSSRTTSPGVSTR
jgi:hypothetical protein